MPSDRVLSVWDLSVPEIREYAGVHAYDGVVMDLSPAGLAAGLARLGVGPPEADEHDETHLRASESSLRVAFGEVEMPRWNPLVHLANLDLSCYDRDYAPAAERRAARARHLEAWPEAIDSSLESLDQVPAPVATALLGAVTGLAAGVFDESPLLAHERLCERLRDAATRGDPSAALGSKRLASLMSQSEAMPVDLARLEEAADRERVRLRDLLSEDCERFRRGSSADPRRLVEELGADHPGDDDLYRVGRGLCDEVSAFVVENGLLGDLGASCEVAPAPESRRFALAMVSWTGAYEPDAPARFYLCPVDPSWDESSKRDWRSVFSSTTFPAVAAHEVAPGHFAHGCMIRQLARGDVRRSLCSAAFVEGWAHYAEELMVEVGFRADDPRFAIGVWLEALVRVTRLAVALGVHGGTLTVEEATRRFQEDAFLRGPAARSEAARAAFDPTYGRYTWGKLEIRKLRDEAIARWGPRFSLKRFHEALLSLGAPPLGTMGDIFTG